MPSIAEIARYAEVSRCAASQILNKSRGYQRFSPDLQQRVRTIAEQLGWQPDSRGLALQRGRTGVLALSLQSMGRRTGLMQAIVNAVERAARKHDQYLQIIGGTCTEAVDAVKSNRCDGVMAIGWSLSNNEIEYLKQCNHSILCEVPAGLNGVAFDVSAGLTRAVSYLHSLGHRTLLWLHASINSNNDARYAVCKKIANTFGMQCRNIEFPLDDLYANEYEEVRSMRQALQTLLPEICKTTAVICYNELIAISLFGAGSGIVQFPRDLSVIGVDDVHAPLTVPALTSVSFNLEHMAETAVQQLLDRKPGLQRNHVDSSLSIRESCAEPRATAVLLK